MSANSKIEWTDATRNPVRGCAKISPGCLHCYAETFVERFRGVPGHPFEQGFDLRLVPEKLGDPLRWPTSKMIFVSDDDLNQRATIHRLLRCEIMALTIQLDTTDPKREIVKSVPATPRLVSELCGSFETKKSVRAPIPAAAVMPV